MSGWPGSSVLVERSDVTWHEVWKWPASLICLSSVQTLFVSVLCSLHQQQRVGALKQPHKPSSNVLRSHCLVLRATSAPNLFSDPSLYLFYKGEIDDRALLGIWQQDRKIVHSIWQRAPNILWSSVLKAKCLHSFHSDLRGTEE